MRIENSKKSPINPFVLLENAVFSVQPEIDPQEYFECVIDF